MEEYAGTPDLIASRGLYEELDDARRTIAELQGALESRVLVEQAKGVLHERFDWSVDEAFAILCDAARSSRTSIHALAAEIVAGEQTPSAIVLAITRTARGRRAALPAGPAPTDGFSRSAAGNTEGSWRPNAEGMAMADLNEQLTKYLTDAHSIEEQALAQLRRAPDIAGDPQIAAAFEEHLAETEGQEQDVRALLDARDADPSRVKDRIMAAGGIGFILFARTQPDTPGKLVAHALSYEALELASYELLARVARQAGEDEVAQVAERIRDQEQAMIDRLEALFDRSVDASLRAVGNDDLDDQLKKYLTDAHAIEEQATKLLERGQDIVGDDELAAILDAHLAETRRHSEVVEQRLEALGGDPSSLKDAMMRMGALNWGTFFQAHPDTPGKLAAFAFAFEHLEIGGYEQLKRVAERAGDAETAKVADTILAEERAAAEKLAGAFDRAAQASLEAVGAA